MPRTFVVCSHVFTLFSQFSNGCCRHLTVLPLRRLILTFSRRIFFRKYKHAFLRQALTATCLSILLITYHASPIPTYGQSATATLSGTVTDPNNAVVRNVSIAVINIAQGFERSATTNDDGAFVVPLLPPGNYIVKAEREGFVPAEVRDVVLNVNDQLRLKIPLKVGGVDQTVDIVDTPPLIDESPEVGVVVDRSQVENMPLNGRSFQSLITLSPGVLLTKAGNVELGQFSVNGQRADANYFTVDGVSANIGTIAANVSQFVGGTLPGLSVSGGTNNLVSVDALQEFKIQTSSYAAEFGRQPGAQVQIATRSGTNDFHGTLFDYFRNDVFDANDWFNNAIRAAKPATRQHDFGGVLGGPILLPRFGEGGRQPWYNGRNRTFFFFSYEGLRLRQPQTAPFKNVPTLATRLSAPAALQPYLSIFPLPNGPNTVNGYAQFNASFSVPSTLDATSIRVDHTLSSKQTFFVRYNYAPSDTVARGIGGALSIVNPVKSKTVTLTAGVASILSPKISNDFRINYSTNEAKGSFEVDGLGGGARPADSLLFPSFTSSRAAQLNFSMSDGQAVYSLGTFQSNLQRQLNALDNVSLVTGSHHIKFGIDYRRMFPEIAPRPYGLTVTFTSVSQIPTSRPAQIVIQSEITNKEPVFTNLSLYGQDTWRISRRFTLNYGMRWEVNPPPTEKNGIQPAVATGFDNPATISLLPFGTPLYKTTYNNFAPRIGLAYQLFQHPGREAVLRGGFGIFYDLGTATAGGPFQGGIFPYGALRLVPPNTPFPLTDAQAAPPTVNLTSPISIRAFDPNLKLPRTYQWNIAVEQSLGANQTVSASYVGAAGRRLLRQETINNPNPTFSFFTLTRNEATSDYHALQLQVQRRLSRGLQVLASYTWSKSLDNVSFDTINTTINTSTPVARLDPQLDRGPSDFDVRHSFNGALSYNIPALAKSTFAKAILQNWAIDTIMTARSATPVNVTITRNIGFGSFAFRPDLIPGIPLYLDDPNAPGGRRFNNTRVPGNPRQVGPFLVPAEPRQGTLGRNSLRGFPVHQLDFALRRQFSLTEKLNLQFKAEIFNILNHPNFGDPSGNLGTNLPTSSSFGLSDRMWGKSLGTGGTIGGFNPLYQVGGPRSMQFSLKFQF